MNINEIDKEVGRSIFGRDAFDVFHAICHDVIDFFEDEKFKIRKDEGFEKLTKNKFLFNKLYWNEQNDRAKFCSLIAILRAWTWISSICDSAIQGNALSFSSSARGFLESSGDTLQVIPQVIQLYIDNGDQIKKSCRGRFGKKLMISPLTENLLLHFEFGGSIRNKKELLKSDFPIENIALRSSEYISQLNKFTNTDYREMYSLLCGFVHPSNLTVWSFSNRIEKSNFKIFSIDYSRDRNKEIIDVIIRDCKIQFEHALMHLNAPLFLLKKLNNLGFTRIPCSLEKANFDFLDNKFRMNTALSIRNDV